MESHTVDQMVAKNNQRRFLGDYTQHQGPHHFSSIVNPTKGVEMKPALLSLITTNHFSGLDQEKPFNHLAMLYELCGTLGTDSDDEKVVSLRLFCFSLIGKAKTWLQSHLNQKLTSWGDVEKKFLPRFFSLSKYISLKATIKTFSHGVGEQFCEVLERYKALLKKCLNHGSDDITQYNMFYNGPRPQTRMLFDAFARGTMMLKNV